MVDLSYYLNQVLIEKEWISFGHKFRERVGQGKIDSHSHKDDKRSPIFVQFIDAIWQFSQWWPNCFEFNENFLLAILHSLISWFLFKLFINFFLVNTELF